MLMSQRLHHTSKPTLVHPTCVLDQSFGETLRGLCGRQFAQ